MIHASHFARLSLISLLLCISIPAWPKADVANLTRQAEQQMQQGLLKQSLESYRQALSQNGNYLPALVGMGRVYAQLGSTKESLAILHIALKLRLDDALVHTELAETYMLAGDINQARESYRRALQVQSGYFRAEFGMARVLSASGKYQASESLLNRLIKKNPMRQEVYFELALLYLKSKDMANAQRILDRAEAVNPDSADLFLWRAIIAMQQYHDQYRQNGTGDQSKLDAAMTLLQLAERLKSEQKQGHILALKGQILLLKREWQQADMIFDALLEQIPDSSLYYYQAGYIAEQGGNANKALQRFYQAYLQNSNDSIAHTYLEQFLIRHNFPVNHPVRRALAASRLKSADFFYQKNLIESSIYELKRSLLLDPYSIEAHERLLAHYKDKRLHSQYISQIQQILDKLHPAHKKLISKYRLLLEKSIYQRRSHLYYQNSLQYPFNRQSIKVALMPMERNFFNSQHPGITDIFQDLLAFQFDINGRWQVAPDDEADFQLSMAITESSNRLHLACQLKQASTGFIIDEFSLEDFGSKAVDRLTGRTAKHLEQLLPAFGQIIKLDPDMVIINMGEIEGLSPGSQVHFYRLSRDSFFNEYNNLPPKAIAQAEVVTVDGFISRLRFSQPEIQSEIRLDDIAVYLETKETNANK